MHQVLGLDQLSNELHSADEAPGAHTLKDPEHCDERGDRLLVYGVHC